jgi:hypothetical protein
MNKTSLVGQATGGSAFPPRPGRACRSIRLHSACIYRRRRGGALGF